MIKNEITALIHQSTLSTTDKQLFLEFVDSLDQGNMHNLAELLRHDPNLLNILTHNLKQKLALQQLNNNESWPAILADEINLLLSQLPISEGSEQ